MNNTWKVSFTGPLLRPGITFETEVSERDLVTAVNKGMSFIREINSNPPECPHVDKERVVGKNPSLSAGYRDPYLMNGVEENTND